MGSSVKDEAPGRLLTAPFDIVVVPFPFTDRDTIKRRPALVMSSRQYSEESDHVIAAMITTTRLRWPSDVELLDAEASGLVAGSRLRFTIFTLPRDLIVRLLGRTSDRDMERIRRAMDSTLPISG